MVRIVPSLFTRSKQKRESSNLAKKGEPRIKIGTKDEGKGGPSIVAKKWGTEDRNRD